MVAIEGDGLAKCREPDGHLLAGNAVDQIDADIFNSSDPGGPDGGNGLLPVVATAEKGQNPVIEGLNADVEAVHPGAAERGEETLRRCRPDSPRR